MNPRFAPFVALASLTSSLVVACAGARSDHPPDGDAGPADGGSTAPAKVSVNVSSADLGAASVGSSSALTAIAVTNEGTTPTGPLAAMLAGPQASVFSIGQDTCSGQRLAGGATCGVDVAFSPTAPGAVAATLTVSAAPGGSASVALTGTGYPAGSLSVSPATMTFVPLVDGVVTTPTTFTVTSSGSPASMLALSLTGTGAAQFTLTSDSCSGEALAASGSCTVELAFAPMVVGPITAALSATSSIGAASAALMGVGLEAGVPAQIAWGEAQYDAGATQSSTTTTLVLANSGSVAAGIPTFSTSGPNARDFTVGETTCDAGIQAAMTCNVTVTFTPTTMGPESATLAAQSDPGGVATTVLVGSGGSP